MTNHTAAILNASEYFEGAAPEMVQITQEFSPKHGWSTFAHALPLTRANVATLRSSGVTTIGLSPKSNPGRVADFKVADLLKFDRRPLLNGNLI